MDSQGKRRPAPNSGKPRATAFLLLVAAGTSGWLALSGHLFTLTNGSMVGLALTSALILAAMCLALAAAAVGLRAFVSRTAPAIPDVRAGRSNVAAKSGLGPSTRRDKAA